MQVFAGRLSPEKMTPERERRLPENERMNENHAFVAC